MCLPYVFDHFDSERHSGVELLILFAQLKAANETVPFLPFKMSSVGVDLQTALTPFVCH